MASLLVVLALVAGVWALIGAATSAKLPGAKVEHPRVVLFAGNRQVASFASEDYRDATGALDRGRLARAVIGSLPPRSVLRTAYANVAVRYLRRGTARLVAAELAHEGGKVVALRRPIASVIDVPVRKQSMRNNCESAAMSNMLDALGVPIDQDRLQAKFPRSGPLDPQGAGSARVWGDPELGYVGRPEGGGVAGGFGIYPPPLIGVGRDLGVRLRDLTGTSPAGIYDRLLRGLPVMVWVGLSDGPYGQWQSPQGRQVKVNFGEHTVVLSGRDRDGSVRVSNPLEGTSERWSKEQFVSMWDRLGRRALGPVR